MIRLPNLISGLLLLACGVYVVATGAQFPLFVDTTLGPGFFPILIGTALIGLVLLMMWQDIRSGTARTEPMVAITRNDVVRMTAIGLVVVLYVIALPRLGFLVSTPLALLGMMLILERGSVLTKVIATGLATALFYAVFYSLLRVPLP